jgi:hypothetical protein
VVVEGIEMVVEGMGVVVEGIGVVDEEIGVVGTGVEPPGGIPVVKTLSILSN